MKELQKNQHEIKELQKKHEIKESQKKPARN